MPKANKTIRDMDEDIWKRGVACAEQNREMMAEWLARAITRLADEEAGLAVLPPDKRAGLPPDKLEVRVPDIDLAAWAAALNAACDATERAGAKVPKAFADDARSTIGRYNRAVRGLPPKSTRQPSRKTIQGSVAEVGQLTNHGENLVEANSHQLLADVLRPDAHDSGETSRMAGIEARPDGTHRQRRVG